MVKFLLGVYMKIDIDGKEYEVIIIKKNNKNSYIRVKEDLSIVVTTSYFTTKRQIVKMLNDNVESIKKMLNRQIASQEKNKTFFYLGNAYDIIKVTTLNDIQIENDKIYVPSNDKLEKWYKKKMIEIFNDRLSYNFNLFEETDKYPNLKIRKMKTRWGVYNRIKHNVTLNSELIKYDIKQIDYVIIHELCHIIHFDHSKKFWNLVSKYCPDYKNVRKELKK